MPPRDVASRLISSSIEDLETEHLSRKKPRSRSNPRYTQLSVEKSNVTPLRRDRANNRQRSSDRTAKNRATTNRTQSPRNKVTSISRRKSEPTNDLKVGSIKKRIKFLVAVLLIPFLLLSARLVEVQILDSEKYASLGVAQRRIVRDIVPDRGSITDRNGNILATTEPAFSVIADPSIIEDDFEVISQLGDITVFDEDRVAEQLSNKNSRYAVLVKHVDEATKKRVQSASIPGVYVIKDNKREYPGRDIAANVIGFVGADQAGLGGLEYMLEAELAGTKGEEVIERDPKGREIPSNSRSIKKAIRGVDITTTLDQGLQYEAQRVLIEEVKATNSKGGTAIVADIKTGDILTMVSVTGGPVNPTAAPATDRNFAVTDVYEPGSTNKVITVAGALEENIISPRTSFLVNDSITYDDKTFRDSEPHEPMTWNASDILRESSNVGTILISNKLKRKNLDFYMREFGFGSKTALNFPGEAKGILLDPENWSDTSIATVPIGNGLAVTPIQMLSVYMTIANKGIKTEPRLVKGYIDQDGSLIEHEPVADQRVISERTSLQLHSMLRGVVTDGTGKLAAIAGYSVAGKTGTARKPPYDKPPYRYVASFAGFAPVSNPRLAAIVVLDEPQGQIYGGRIAAPVFSRIMQSSLRVMGVQSDENTNGLSLTNTPSNVANAAE